MFPLVISFYIDDVYIIDLNYLDTSLDFPTFKIEIYEQ